MTAEHVPEYELIGHHTTAKGRRVTENRYDGVRTFQYMLEHDGRTYFQKYVADFPLEEMDAKIDEMMIDRFGGVVDA